MLFDAHNHLQDPALDPHWPAIARDLEKIGLEGAALNGTCEADWPRVRALAQSHPWALPCYGLHPWFIRERSPHWQKNLEDFVSQSLQNNAPVGIGEIGLDRWIDNGRRDDLDEQQEVFRRQLALAAKHNLPASIHCLQAWGALWETLRACPLPPRGFLLHAYSGPREMAEGFLALGARFSFPGAFLRERKAERRALFRALPADRLLVETDAPHMPPPQSHRPFTLPSSTNNAKPLNHPANLRAIYEGLAALRGCSLEELATQAAENFRRLFGNAIGESGARRGT